MAREVDIDDPEIQAALAETSHLASLESRSVPAQEHVVLRRGPAPNTGAVISIADMEKVPDLLDLANGELNFGGVETTLSETERTAVMRIIVKACKRAITERAKGTKKEGMA